MSKYHSNHALWAVILLTWSSPTPDALVAIERRPQPGITYTTLATVPGQYYLDMHVQPGQRYCYRVRYQGAARWTLPTCATARPTSTPLRFDEESE